MEIKINEDCIGCGLCQSVCPQVFQMEGARSVPVDDSEEFRSLAEEAAEACPVAAIEIV